MLTMGKRNGDGIMIGLLAQVRTTLCEQRVIGGQRLDVDEPAASRLPVPPLTTQPTATIRVVNLMNF